MTKLYDPYRPVNGAGTKLILGMEVAVPQFDIFPSSDGVHVELGAMLPTGHGGSAWEYLTVKYEELGELVKSYYLDPEATLARLFKWTPKETLRPVPTRTRRQIVPTGSLDMFGDDGDDDQATEPESVSNALDLL